MSGRDQRATARGLFTIVCSGGGVESDREASRWSSPIKPRCWCTVIDLKREVHDHMIRGCKLIRATAPMYDAQAVGHRLSRSQYCSTEQESMKNYLPSDSML